MSTIATARQGSGLPTPAGGYTAAGLGRPTGARDAVPAPESTLRLAVVRTVAVAAVLATGGYLTWRLFSTLPEGPALWIGVPFLALELYGGIGLVLFVMTTWNVAPATVPPPRPGPAPSVTVLVATYNEHLDVLLPTVAACLAMAGDHETWVLDDGDRLEVEEMVTALGARYVSRAEHDHAKAGNLNHALGLVQTELVAVFDADHVPEPEFLTRTVPYFADDRLALVQTPQHFYNTTSFEHLRPDVDLHEESLFYRVIQPGKHHAGAAFWCGTNAVLRASALREIGGVATESLTEDFHTTMKLHRAGWRSAYHNEVLARGLAAGSPDAFYAQRRRWGRGAMQVIQHDNPLTATGLTLRQRLGYLYSLSAWFDSWRTLGMALVPVAVLVTGLFPVEASPAQFALMAGVPYLLQQVALTLLSRGFASARFSLLFEVVRLPSNLAATLTLVRRGTGRFAVTAKGRTGEARTRARVPRLLLVLAAVLVGGLLYTAASTVGWTPTRHGPGAMTLIPVFWAVVTLGFVLAAIRRIRDPRFSAERREGHRFPATMQAVIDGVPARLVDVSLGGAQVRARGAGATVGAEVELAIRVPDRAAHVVFRATVRSRQGDVHRLQFTGRQWAELAALSATAFGAGAARWAAAAEVTPSTVPAPSTRARAADGRADAVAAAVHSPFVSSAGLPPRAATPSRSRG
ncbi:glycosyltransferase [Blastococcus saxobsidens]|uniref:Putative Cellulose synthase (UDP-forming) n=1 Tax=Blastococcus saxobsidens (strain DD2) TaxID=1146883 RepID=H6RUX9_BLASD|nr:glycosyltransferase [Blastococcus saxobsidens]CCG04501.1 putative Cellulose synthase (UDP-forming) [Blastococcus saxobsidens DD2]